MGRRGASALAVNVPSSPTSPCCPPPDHSRRRRRPRPSRSTGDDGSRPSHPHPVPSNPIPSHRIQSRPVPSRSVTVDRSIIRWRLHDPSISSQIFFRRALAVATTTVFSAAAGNDGLPRVNLATRIHLVVLTTHSVSLSNRVQSNDLSIPI